MIIKVLDSITSQWVLNNRYAIVGWPSRYRLSIKLYCEKIEWLWDFSRGKGL